MPTENQLQQVIELIEKTGDKAIVLDKGAPAYVVMRLKDYESLILGKSGVRGLTEEELLDKINREIAIWRNQQEKEPELSAEENGRSQAESWDDIWQNDFESKDSLADDLDQEFDNYRSFEEDKFYVEPIK